MLYCLVLASEVVCCLDVMFLFHCDRYCDDVGVTTAVLLSQNMKSIISAKTLSDLHKVLCIRATPFLFYSSSNMKYNTAL